MSLERSSGLPSASLIACSAASRSRMRAGVRTWSTDASRFGLESANSGRSLQESRGVAENYAASRRSGGWNRSFNFRMVGMTFANCSVRSSWLIDLQCLVAID